MKNTPLNLLVSALGLVSAGITSSFADSVDICKKYPELGFLALSSERATEISKSSAPQFDESKNTWTNPLLDQERKKNAVEACRIVLGERFNGDVSEEDYTIEQVSKPMATYAVIGDKVAPTHFEYFSSENPNERFKKLECGIFPKSESGRQRSPSIKIVARKDSKNGRRPSLSGLSVEDSPRQKSPRTGSPLEPFKSQIAEEAEKRRLEEVTTTPSSTQDKL